VLQPEEKAFIQRDDLIQFFPAERKQDIALLARNLRLISAGTFLATVKHDKLIPEHTLALSLEINREHFNCLALTDAEALCYLRKETLALTPSLKGFALVMHEGQGIGWANVLPNRINNLYPSEWRIRMQ
jgi:NOL1/NOP2/fmu family ribosome biogenesis protein